MFTVERLTTGSALPYQSLVFPSMHKCLMDLSPDSPYVAVGAQVDGIRAGLALGEVGTAGLCDVRSLFVSASYRGRGVATALLSEIEEVFREAGRQSVQISYIAGRPTAPALERILQKLNWGSPESKMLICRLDRRMLEWEWVKKARMAPGFEIFSWNELTDDDRRSILERQKQSNWIPEDLIPFQYENDFEPLTSVGLRLRGEPVGWVITHRVAEDTIRYTCSFIRKDLQRRFHIGPLYREAFYRQLNQGIPHGIWLVPFQHTSMVAFVKKYWGGGFASMNESRGAAKSLIHAYREASGGENGR